jgi:hypothetical protein
MIFGPAEFMVTLMAALSSAPGTHFAPSLFCPSEARSAVPDRFTSEESWRMRLSRLQAARSLSACAFLIHERTSPAGAISQGRVSGGSSRPPSSRARTMDRTCTLLSDRRWARLVLRNHQRKSDAI